jgi:H+-transporting ATPase
VTELRALIRQMSTENLLWGAPRIHGELLKLGFSVAHAIGLFDLAFCVTLLTFGSLVMHLDIDTLRTMTLVTLAFNGQAVFYVVRERRRLWSSRPSLMVIVSSILDVLIIGTLALRGILMAPLEPSIVASIFAAAIVLACIMDQVKIWLFAHFKMA